MACRGLLVRLGDFDDDKKMGSLAHDENMR